MTDRFKKKTIIYKILLLLLACVCAAYLCYTLVFQPSALSAESVGQPEILSNWYAQIDGAPYGSVSIPGPFYSKRQVSLFKTLPIISESDYLSIHTANTRIRIFADKELIYEFGFESGEYTSIPPILYEHRLNLKPEYTGKRLRIDLYPMYFPANRITRPILLGSIPQIQLFNFTTIRGDTYGYSFGAIGLVILIFGLYYFFRDRKDTALLVLSALYLLLCTKLCTQSCLTTSVITNLYTSFYIFWFSLLVAPLTVIILLFKFFGQKMRVFFWRMICGYVVFIIAALSLIIIDIDFYVGIISLFYVLITILMIAISVRLRIFSKLKTKNRSTILLALLLFMILVDVTNHYFQYLPFDFSFWLVFAAFFFTFIIIANKVKETHNRDKELQTIRMKSESLLQSYKEIDAYTTKIEKIRHDMNKHLSVINTLLNKDDTRNAQEYICNLLTDAETQAWRTVCPNPIINAILSQKLQQAEKLGVDFTYSIRLPQSLNIADVDICSVFANCLDNALRAASLVGENRRIVLVTYIKNNHLYLSVENTAPVCTLPVRKGHGLGLKIIRDVTKKYDGIMDITNLQGLFKIEVALNLF